MPPFDATSCGIRRKVVGQFYMENWRKGRAFTYKHFKNMQVPKSTLYRIMRQCDEGVSLRGRVAAVVLQRKCPR